MSETELGKTEFHIFLPNISWVLPDNFLTSSTGLHKYNSELNLGVLTFS